MNHSNIPSMKILPFFLTAASAILLASCSSTPTSRIEKNPQIFHDLTPSAQSHVRAGHITKGMPETAVFLAWGWPDRQSAGMNDKGPFKRWEYTSQRPVYTSGFYSNFGYGYGHSYGRHRYNYNSFGFGPHIEYLPFTSAAVLFEKGKVSEWERLDR